MNIRDQVKTADYWREHIEYEIKTQERFKKKLLDPTLAPTHRSRLQGNLFHRKFELISSQFSAGEKLPLLRKSFLELVKEIEKTSKTRNEKLFLLDEVENYHIFIQIISLAEVLGIKQENIKTITSNSNQENWDKIIYFLLEKEEREGIEIKHKNYQYLYDFIKKEGAENSKILSYLEQWTDKFKECYWHDSHKVEDSGYFGYWSWEAAATVKILKTSIPEIDQSIFFPILSEDRG